MNGNGSEAHQKVEVKVESGSVQEIKAALQTIEGLFNAVNAATFPLAVYPQAMRGMGFLKAMHAELYAKLTPEQIEQAKKEARDMREAEMRAAQMPKPPQGN